MTVEPRLQVATPVAPAEPAGVRTGTHRRSRWLGVAAATIGLVALALYGAGLSRYSMQLVTVALLYAIVAISLDVAWGYTGILSMGHAVFFGLGAYGVGVVAVDVAPATGAVIAVARHWWTFPAGMLLGIAVATAIAVFVGVFAFSGKATPFYVAVVTLALTVILVTVFEHTSWLGRQGGLQSFAVRTIAPSTWYWIAVGTLVVATLIALVAVRSDCGVLLRSIRDNEARARYLGFHTARVKLVVFAASAATAAVAGALYAGFIGFVSPPFLGFLVATEILIWVAVGGRGTLFGPIIGAVAINLVGPRLSAEYPYQWTLILGLLFIAVVTFIPDGLLPGALRAFKTVGGHLRPEADRVTSTPETREIRPVDKATASVAELPAPESALSVSDVHRSFGALQVLKGVSIEVRRGELLAIIGPNGAGKSTLLGALGDGTIGYSGSVVLHRSAGDIELHGRTPRTIVAAGAGRGFQTPNLFETLTPLETVLLGSRAGRIPSIWRRSRHVTVSPETYEVCRATGLLTAASTPVADLSHGLKKALELAVTVALQPEVLLLDEPTAGLTADERALIGDLLRHIVEAKGITIVLIEHDFELVRRIADRIAVLHEGQVRLIGTVDEVADSALLKQVYLGATT
jgi:branched-chain amino acid transport system permease protein